MMLTPGVHPQVWRDFSLASVSAVTHYEYPDDQAWIAHKVPAAAGWRAGPSSGLYAFMKPGWPKGRTGIRQWLTRTKAQDSPGGESLPPDARLVVFPGFRDPSQFVHLTWVQRHWLGRT